MAANFGYNGFALADVHNYCVGICFGLFWDGDCVCYVVDWCYVVGGVFGCCDDGCWKCVADIVGVVCVMCVIDW